MSWGWYGMGVHMFEGEMFKEKKNEKNRYTNMGIIAVEHNTISKHKRITPVSLLAFKSYNSCT